MNAAQHWKRAEALSARAVQAINANPSASPADLATLANLELDLARTASDVLLSVDRRRDVDDIQAGEGWPPSRGDVWRDSDGNQWQYESTGRMVCLNNNANADPAEVSERFGPMLLVYRPFIPSLDDLFDGEPPF